MLKSLLVCVLVILANYSYAKTGQPTYYDSIDDVVSNENLYLGKLVLIKGYLRFGDDSRNLWSTRKAYLRVVEQDTMSDDPAWNRCITLYDFEAFREELIAHNNDYVLVRGVIRRSIHQEGEITTSACNELGISVQSVKSR